MSSFASDGSSADKHTSLRSVFHLVLLVVATLKPTREAVAGTFAVTPTTITLNPQRRSALLKFSNLGGDPIHFQVSAYVWTQDEQGQMALTPSPDLVAYPTLFTIGPGDSHNIRVGSTTGADGQEASYQLAVEERPARLDADSNPGIRILTRMSFPVFVEPIESDSDGDIQSAILEKGRVSVQIANECDVELKLDSVQVIGRDDDGKEVFSESARGWYVLSGDAMEFGVIVSAELCPTLRTLDVHTITADETRTRSVVATGAQGAP